MARNDARDDSDPVRRRERDLEAEQKAVAAQLAEMRAQLEQIKNPPPEAPQPTVWHAPVKTDPERSPAAPAGPTRRIHSAQRRRDRTKFVLLCIGFLLVVAWIIRVLR